MASRNQPTTEGFTLVELLIVIVVLAILASISVIAYNGIQDRARNSQADSMLAQAKNKLALYHVDNDSYPVQLSAVGIEDTGY